MYGRRLAPFVPVPCECSGNGKAHQGATDHRKRREFDAIGELVKAALERSHEREQDQAADKVSNGPTL